VSDDISSWTNEVHEGDCREVLSEMPESSVHMCMTSPPYYGLRDYGVEGQIGLEDTLDEYIQKLVDVGRELRRVLRDDGSWWLNLGDSYAGSNSTAGATEGRDDAHNAEAVPDESVTSDSFLGRKNKMLVPHRVAIALQEDGWVVRNDVTWVKPNPMPSSVKDRLNTTTEQIFHLTPERDYWYDLDAIREAHKEESIKRDKKGYPETPMKGRYKEPSEDRKEVEDRDTGMLNPAGKNPGDVFEVTTKPYPDAHFAVYPPELCEKPIKATCPPKVCADCGAPYIRDKTEPEREYERGNEEWRDGANINNPQRDHDGNWNYEAEFHGWMQDCDCDTSETEAGIALDPFAGAGTTCMVAKRERRRFVGIDLNGEYCEMAREREMEEQAGKICDGQRQATLEALAQTDGGATSDD